MKNLKIHKRAKGFTWLTLCGMISNKECPPTEKDNLVTCKLCKNILQRLAICGG